MGVTALEEMGTEMQLMGSSQQYKQTKGSLEGRTATVQKTSVSTLKAAGGLLKAVGQFFSSLVGRKTSSSSKATHRSQSRSWTIRKVARVGLATACGGGLVVLGLKISSLLIPFALLATGLYLSTCL